MIRVACTCFSGTVNGQPAHAPSCAIEVAKRGAQTALRTVLAALSVIHGSPRLEGDGGTASESPGRGGTLGF